MTDEERAEEYAEHEQCAYCSNPLYCQGKDECYDFANIKSHFLAGLEAGKDIAEPKVSSPGVSQSSRSKLCLKKKQRVMQRENVV